ncbi:MAG: SDR family oxidoreductase [bacterium]|nr:SDR family oxidoreductase [bacterium]
MREVTMEQLLAGKVAIVTGASSGIGAATARELASQGAKVVLAARSAGRLRALAGEIGSAATSVPTDVTRGDDVERLVAKTMAEHGRIDILFANAGVYIAGQAAEGNPDAWAGLMDVNINGVLRCIHAVLPHMLARRAGDILVTSSISGCIDIQWEPIYSASKHAIQSLVHTLRRQVAAAGIRVGSIAPGMVANELWGITEKEAVDKLVAERASLRCEDVAAAVVFMLTRPAHVIVRDLVMLPQNQDL